MQKKPKGTRKGFTTGACTAAAAKAAVTGLLTGKVPAKIQTLLPNGTMHDFAVFASSCNGNQASAVIVKDAGDDPDCTHLAHLTVHIKKLMLPVGEIILAGGAGVGTITMPGLGLRVGSAAINPVPRQNIIANIRAVAGDLLQDNGLEVTVSVPDGEKMAKKTLNSRLGIVGGISILGTTGIVHPYSTAAFRASVVQGVQVAATQQLDTVVLTTGGRTEKFARRELPNLQMLSFVQMGDFLAPALDAAAKYGIKHIIIGGMVGKLCKMAQGETITHARRNPVNTALLADIAATVGASPKVCTAIRDGETARYAAECMDELGLAQDFFQALARAVATQLATRYPNTFRYTILICDFDGKKLTKFASEE